MRANDGTRTGGEILIDQLVVHGVQHAFCVPGESYLAALDAFVARGEARVRELMDGESTVEAELRLTSEDTSRVEVQVAYAIGKAAPVGLFVETFGTETVDPHRIGVIGLSYGGKTAMRVPPLVDRYCAVICSGDFNEWIVKTTSVRHKFSYVGTGEYEIWEWNLANTFNYAEMAGLICPRPFMVERGHRDGVGIDEWVDYEYAKVRLLYVDLKIPERTEIEHFDGPHEINGVGSYKFLHKHLNLELKHGLLQGRHVARQSAT